MTEEVQTEQENAAADYAEAWKPSAGDVITGTLADVKMIDPNGKGAYPVVTLVTPDGERAVHAYHRVLRNELARNAPKNGEEVTITYLGERPGGKNGTYHAYRVRGSGGREFNWDSELPAEERASVPIAPAPVGGAGEQVRQAQAQQAQVQTAQAAEKNFGGDDSVPF